MASTSRMVMRSAKRLGFTGSVLAGTGLSWLSGYRPSRARLLRETFEKLGTTYIKLGQFIASSPSLFPEEYVREFQKCLDRTPVVPFSVIAEVLQEDLPQPVSEIFASIDEVPLASASIAQVHAARLVTGEDVVIKVQKPGVRTILSTDLNFLYASARLAERFLPTLKIASIGDIVEEIHKSMMEECDFVQEARNLDAFNAFLEDTGNEQAVAPQVYRHASGQRVLTMERFYGVPLTDLESIRHVSKDPSGTLVTAMNTWFASLMHCESFHADLHAGNLMVLHDGRLGFIDFGIVGRIAPETWAATTQFIDGIGMRDFQALAEAMAVIGMTREKVDVAHLASDVRELFDRVEGVSPDTLMDGEVMDTEINQLLMEIVAVGRRHGIRFPRAFALLLKQLLYFDRYVRILAPEMNVFDDERLDFLQLEADPA